MKPHQRMQPQAAGGNAAEADSLGHAPTRAQYTRLANAFHDGRALTVLALLLEVALLVQLVRLAATGDARVWSSATHVTPLLLTHGMAALAALLSWWQAQRSTSQTPRLQDEDAFESITDRSGWQLLALGIVALGPVGVVGAGLSWMLKRWYDDARLGARRSMDAKDRQTVPDGKREGRDHSMRADSRLHDDETPPTPELPMSARVVLSRRHARSSVRPFDDVLERGTPDQKRQMIEAIVAHYQPSFARTLRRAMRDADPMVRMLAAAATSRLENEFLETSMKYEDSCARHPDDAKRALRLARHYDEFARSRLMDPLRTQQTRERALEVYQFAATHLPDDDGILRSRMRLLLKLRREEEAMALFRPRLEAGQAPTSMVSWYLECLYRSHRFTELRELAEQLCAHGFDLERLNAPSASAIRWWAREAPATDEAFTDPREGMRSRPPRQARDPKARRAAGAGSRESRENDVRQKNILDLSYFAPRWAKDT